MLTELHIRNIVLISACDIAFGPGLCVLTGETGAGKSILLDALGLALGARAEARLVRQGEAQGSVTAQFDLARLPAVRAWLAEQELGDEAALIIRRSLSADGKSKCLVNDRPVAVQTLKTLGDMLVEVHGQHDQHGMLDPAAHLALLDGYGQHGGALAEVAEAYAHWRAAQKAHRGACEALAKAAKEEEYLRHLQAELRELAVKEGEEEQLSDQRTRMMAAEKLAQTLQEALEALEGTQGALPRMVTAERALSRCTLPGSDAFAPALEALERAGNEVGEAVRALEVAARALEYDESALEELEERLFALRAASRKYAVPVDALPGVLEEAVRTLDALSLSEAEVQRAAQTEAAARTGYLDAAQALRALREGAAEGLAQAVASELPPLKLASTQFRVALVALPEAQWGAAGMDSAQFEVATNVTAAAEPQFGAMMRIASGGELSRFMLALKVALASVAGTPTLIFDEIDTGTGGAVADAIGQRLSRLGQEVQVLVVTHLPQVAARGDTHLHIRKEVRDVGVRTEVHPLAHNAREEELARMLSGAEITDEARRAAVRLLG